MNKVFSDVGWAHYVFWQDTDRKILRKINVLLQDIERNGHEGIGKPEALRHELAGFWSRRINDTHRLIYSIDGDSILIASCKGHYD